MNILQDQSITIDPERFLVLNDSRPVILTKTEFHILYLLMSMDGKVLSRKSIAEHVWGTEDLAFPRTIDVHISNIRKKIGKTKHGDVIVVHKGLGYKFNSIDIPSVNS